ncbi:MAG: alpha-N-acetylglucosaminidase, partial [Prevotella sp.]|nr:alpha-N-acetylglucosaminidase [Prevotella sp.]
VWVVQAWQACPHPEMIRHLRNGDMLVLDLFSESRPQWGDPESTWYRKNGFEGHNWAYCMLLNYGGNVGLFGKLQHVVDEFYKARNSRFSSTMRGVGLTMEGIENNPVMYELVCDLPWSTADADRIEWSDWLSRYVQARYGNVSNPNVIAAWLLLARSIYGCPADNVSQGCRESVFCARPSLDAKWVSSWAETVDYYEPDSVIRAARLMVEAAADMPANANFRYDLVDITRQAVAERARLVYNEIVAAYKAHDRKMFRHSTQRFLRLLLQQDRLLSSIPDFMVGRWIKQARSIATNAAEADHYEWNARTQITVWGNRQAAEQGGLREYAHKEWSGVLRDFYYPRWRMYFDALDATFDGKPMPQFDFYAIDEAWTRRHNPYPSEAQGDAVEFAREAMAALDEAE